MICKFDNCENCGRLNITRETDVTLQVRLMRDGKAFPVELSEGVLVNIVSDRGRRKSASFQIGEGKVLVPLVGADYGVGVYGVEVKGVLNGANWLTFGSGLIAYTYETKKGAKVVSSFGDPYDIVLEVSAVNDAIPTRLADLADDAQHRTVTDEEKARWNEGSGKIDVVKVNGEPLEIDPTDRSVDIDLSGKQDTISDLDKIRDGAALGATAIQEHQDISGKVDKVEGKGLSTNDYTTEEKTKLAGLENYDDTILSGRVTAVEGKIPAQASEQNKLADKEFVNSSISTNTAIFKGTYNSLADLQQVTADANDYGFVIGTDAAGNTTYSRYKYVEGTGWEYEYTLNNSSFTAEQWAAIQSGITAALVTKLNGLENYDDTAVRGLIAAETTRATAAEQANTTAIAGKVDKVQGKGLSTNDFTDEEKQKIVNLDGRLTTVEGLANAPDQEDLTSVNQGGTDVLKFKDKTYSPALFSGLGRVYLRKNIVTLEGSGKNVLTQAMVNAENTIYHIQYDYDLNGQNIELPAGCMLEFNGGSVKNGMISGNGTIVKDTDEKIFGNGVTIAGTWKNSIIRSSWYEINTNTLNNILSMNDDRATEIYITEDLIASPYDFEGLNVASNTKVFISATIAKSDAVSQTRTILGINNVENVTIIGGMLLGTRETFHATEYGMGIHISNSKNVRVSNMIIKNTTGDGIYITGASSGVVIENCIFEGNGRNGISVINAANVEVNCSTFKNIKYKAPMSGIDLEPNELTEVVRNFSVNNCVFENCQNSLTSAATRGTVENAEMVNCSVYANETISTFLSSAYTQRIRIAGCSFTGTSSASYSIAASYSDSVIFEGCLIVMDKQFNLSSSAKVLFLNSTIDGTGPLFEGINNVLFIGNTITTPKSLGARGINNSSFIKNNLNVGGFINSSGSATNILFENNKVVFDAEYQCIALRNGRHIRIINNDMEMTSNTRSLIVFDNVNDVICSHNAIDVKSNQKLFDVTSSKDVSVMDNLITLPLVYTSQVYNGVNLLTTKSNRKGDRLFFDSIGKYAVFNGERWVDDNNFTAALGKGETASRPSVAELYASDAGFQYYDETLAKPIFLKVLQGTAALTKVNVAKNVIDGDYYGVNSANTLVQGENYIYKTSYHTSRRFKAAFRKTDNTAYEDSDELLIAETSMADNLAIKAPDPTVYPYVFFCNLAYDTQVVTVWFYNVAMEWVDATGATLGNE